MDDVERVVRDWVAAQNAQDTTKLLSLYSDNIRFEDVVFGVILNGKDQYKKSFSQFHGAISNERTELKLVFAAGEWAAAEWVFSGIQTGDWPRIPATGKNFSFRGVSLCRVRDGKVVDRTDFWDGSQLVRQLGVTPGKA